MICAPRDLTCTFHLPLRGPDWTAVCYGGHVGPVGREYKWMPFDSCWERLDHGIGHWQ
jgi:hypothetical protein